LDSSGYKRQLADVAGPDDSDWMTLNADGITDVTAETT
jgi:hypothetical protein